MSLRRQRTIQRPARVSGFGLFRGEEVTVEFLPAPEYHGIVFQRTDLPNPVRIPALIDYVVPRPRRTALSRMGVTVETVEHLLAALAGLQIDNCLVRLNAPEPPIGDGSAIEFAEALLAAEIVEQQAPRRAFTPGYLQIDEPSGGCRLEAVGHGEQNPTAHSLSISYELDYRVAALPPQKFSLNVTPENFMQELASARTFVLESEIAALRQQGFGLKATPQNVLVLRADGTVLDNQFRQPDECVRHKILDCLGDFSLLGCDLAAQVTASHSGHSLNHTFIRQLRDAAAKADAKSPGPTDILPFATSQVGSARSSTLSPSTTKTTDSKARRTGT